MERAADFGMRELAVRFTDEKRYFVSKASVYRLLKAHGSKLLPIHRLICSSWGRRAAGSVSGQCRSKVLYLYPSPIDNHIEPSYRYNQEVGMYRHLQAVASAIA